MECAAAVIAALPVAAVLAGSGDGEAAPSPPGQSVTDESTDGAATGDAANGNCRDFHFCEHGPAAAPGTRTRPRG